jgi:hypothetical protein
VVSGRAVKGACLFRVNARPVAYAKAFAARALSDLGQQAKADRDLYGCGLREFVAFLIRL